MRKRLELQSAIPSCGQGSLSVSSSVPVRPYREYIPDNLLRMLPGLMSNIVDGIQRPLRVGSPSKMPAIID